MKLQRAYTMTKEELEKLLIDFVIEKGLKVQILDYEGTPAYFSDITNALTVEFYYEETEDEQI